MNQQEAIEAAKALGPEWKWVAMDEDGSWYPYKSEPLKGNPDKGQPFKGASIWCGGIQGPYLGGIGDWTQSLAEVAL